jgi:cytochrome P450
MTTTDHAQLDDRLRALFAAEPEALEDPYPLFAQLLREAPVHRHGSTIIVTPYEEARRIYLDAKRFQKFPGRAMKGTDEARARREEFSLLDEEEWRLMKEILEFETSFISRKNGVDHRRVRSAVGRYFTPKRVQALEETVTRLTDDLLEDMARDGQGVIDLMDFAFRLPLWVVMELLGAPLEDADDLKRWGDALQRPLARTPVEPDHVREAHAAVAEYEAYAQGLVKRHRASGSEHSELVSGLLEAERGEQLSERELTAFFLHTILAGHETTANMIGNGLTALLEHREQWDRLRADPELAPSAVDELLRFDPPSQFAVRLVAEDCEFDGVPAPAGTSVTVPIGGANRDPTAFDDPDVLDISRSPNHHLSLGLGPHYCLGSSVVALEGRIVFTALATRFPDIELVAESDALERQMHAWMRGFKHVPIRLRPDSV